MTRRGFLAACLAAVGLQGAPAAPAATLAAPVVAVTGTHPPFIGRTFVMESETFYIKREAYHLEFFAYEGVSHHGGVR